MLNKRLFISGLIVNSLAACSSSPMELPQPKGDWVDFVPATAQPGLTAATEGRKQDTSKATPPVVKASAGLYDTELPNIAADKNRFINDSAKNVPLYKAVRTLVPPSWNVKLSPDVAERFRGTLSWTGGDQWKFVLSKSLNSVGLTPQIDDQHKEVMVKFIAPAVAKTVAVVSQQPGKTNKSTPLSGMATGKKVSNSIVLTPPVIPVATVAAKPPIVKKPAILMPALKLWTINKGTTLKAGYMSWAAKEKCIAMNRDWIIQWDTDTNYPIDYPLSFSSASFEDATTQLFKLYRTAQAPLYVSGYRNQCLIVISDRK